MLSRHKDSVLAKLDEYVGKQGEEFEKFESKVTKNVADLEQAIAYSTAVLERCKDTELLVVLRMILNRLKPLVSERIEPFLLSNGPTLQWNRAEFETALNSHLRVQSELICKMLMFYCLPHSIRIINTPGYSVTQVFVR